MRIATYERPPTRRGLLRGALLAGGAAAAGAAALAGRTAGPLRFPTRGPAGPLVPPTPDQALVHEKLALARAERLHALPSGERVVRLGQTFAGTAYVAATLEAPGAEHLVVNLRELDCVTFVECTLALARVAHSRGGKSGGAAEEYQAFTAELRRLRYRNGEIAGYASRLHYFSDWIADNARKGIVRDISRDLGGVEDARPVTFMSAHPKDYRQLAEPEHLEAIRRVEAALNARPRFHVPADRLLAALPQIRNGDVLAATTSIEGLDIAHTALAIWRDGDLHLLHAPSVGGAVQVSRVPVPEWMRLNRQHTGLMVARPV